MLKYTKVRSLMSPFPGTSNATYYCHVLHNGRTVGMVWKYKDGGYQYNADYVRGVNNRENRPYRASSLRLRDLKAKLSAHYDG